MPDETSPTPFTVRRATAGDIEAVTRFRRAMFEELDDFEAGSLDRMSADFVTYAERALVAEEFVAWVAEADGAPIGTAGLIFNAMPPHPKIPDGKVGYVLNVYVEPSMRRHGVATRLVEAALEHCRAAGVPILALHASDEGAAVYGRLGFQPTSEMRRWL